MATTKTTAGGHGKETMNTDTRRQSLHVVASAGPACPFDQEISDAFESLGWTQIGKAAVANCWPSSGLCATGKRAAHIARREDTLVDLGNFHGAKQERSETYSGFLQTGNADVQIKTHFKPFRCRVSAE